MLRVRSPGSDGDVQSKRGLRLRTEVTRRVEPDRGKHDLSGHDHQSSCGSLAARADLLPALRATLLAEGARPLRFMATGGIAGLLQLLLLARLTHGSWPALEANALAFLLAAQVNFALSVTFTWGDRTSPQPLWRRWALFHASISGMAALNMAVFALAEHMVPALAASTLGIGVAAAGNFLTGDRLVFRSWQAAQEAIEDAA